MKIVLAGGTGFIGKALRRELLSAGHELVVLTRQAQAGEAERETLVAWDGKTAGVWAAHLEGADAVINLAGENIAAKGWTAERKEVLLSSRVNATRAIVTAIGQVRAKPSVLINVSAVGYYGDTADEVLTETSVRGQGFLAETCELWESEARKAEPFGVRVILARLGPVLGEQGGMLSKMIPPFRFFVGAPLGSGRQWIPWVHRDDVIGAFLFMLGCREFSGPVNITAPFPVTMKDLSRALAGVLHRPCWFPAPGCLLRMVLGEMSSIILSSQKALPQKLLKAEYRFRYEHLSAALAAIFRV